MPYNRPGAGVYVTNGSTTLTHGQAVKASNFVGVAVKQQALPWSQGLSGQNSITSGEAYFVITKGIVQVDTVSGVAKGDGIYINVSNVLSTSTAQTPFGRVVELAGTRGTPTGKMRVDLDTKDTQ